MFQGGDKIVSTSKRNNKINMKLNLTYINRKQMTSASNKPYTSLSIKATQYGDKYLSGFGNKANENWKVGDEVEIAEVKEVQKGEKTYLNFEMPKVDNRGGGVNPKTIEEIANGILSANMKLDKIIAHLAKQAPKAPAVISGTDIPYPQMTKAPNFEPKAPEQADSEDIKPEDIPF